jgi:hypothetical protein
VEQFRAEGHTIDDTTLSLTTFPHAAVQNENRVLDKSALNDVISIELRIVPAMRMEGLR